MNIKLKHRLLESLRWFLVTRKFKIPQKIIFIVDKKLEDLWYQLDDVDRVDADRLANQRDLELRKRKKNKNNASV